MGVLNFEKIHHYIHQHGFTLKRTFTRDGMCYLLELMCDGTVQTIYLLLTGYECRTPYESHELTQCVTDKDAQIPTHLLESSYSDLNSMIALSVQGKGTISIEEHIKDKYRKHVILDDVEKEEQKRIQSIVQQLERLQYSVRGIRYSIAITTQQHIGLIVNDDIVVFKCSSIKPNKHRQLVITVDMDLFHDKVATVEEDCRKIVASMEAMLVSNQEKNVHSTTQLMQRRDSIVHNLDFLRECNQKYHKYIDEYLPLVTELNESRQEKQAKLDELRSTVSANIHQEMKRSHQKDVLQKELNEMKRIGDKLVNTVDTIHVKKQNILLKADTIVFNNIVLLDQLFRNIDELKSLEKQV
jgi:hypothetical protein